MDTPRLLAWTDLEARRRVGRARIWGQRIAIAAGLAALVGWRQADRGTLAALATWHSVIVAVFATTMIASALGMFWRHDAGMLARLPIDGGTLLRAALVRAARAAVVAAGTAIVAAAPIAAAAAGGGAHGVDASAVWAALARGGALIVTLTAAASALTPAAAAAAALLVAGGTATAAARSMMAVAQGSPRRAALALATTKPQPVSTTALGALPGTAAAWMVILAITVRWWMFDGRATAIGPALPWLGAAVAVSALALAAVWRRGHGMAVALREVAALDRQRLAHLDIHPPRGLEVVIMRALGARAGLIYSKAARLMRRRYPMAWAIGLSAWVVAIAIAGWKPADAVVWTIGIAGTTAAYAVVLAGRLARPPIELPRLAAELPVPAPARARARVAWVLGWTAVFAVPPTLIAALAAHTGVVPIAVVAAGAIVAIGVAARRGP